MSTAKETHTKGPSETKDLAVDCAGALADAELIVGTPTVAVSAPNDLIITGISVNDVVLSEPGRPDIQIGQGIRAFVVGGTSGTTYTITFSYETDGGQQLEAACRLRVT